MQTRPDCAVCCAASRVAGVLCEGCRAAIAAPIGLLPQQILTTAGRPCGDALVDQWGRSHPLETRTLIGRTLDGPGILIVEASVSRHHAHLDRDDSGEWMLRDLGSTNGTFVNGALITATRVKHGDRLAIGTVGFYLVREIGETAPISVEGSIITTTRTPRLTEAIVQGPDPETFVDEEITDTDLPVVPMRLSDPGTIGGVLQVHNLVVQLSANQLRLVALLARRMLEEVHQPAHVRGFVRSSELVGTLPWDSPAPDDNHVKQLVRRARRRLLGAGFGDLIEARQRFGYRLRVIPSIEHIP